MRPYSTDEVREIAQECRRFLEAHGKRAETAVGATANETTAIHGLRYALAAREREALSAAMGTAA